MKNVKEVTIRLEKEEWTKALDKAFNNKKKDLKVDGFRKGSCPKDIYIKKFGIESLFMDAVDLSINDAYHKAIEESKAVPVCEPKLDITSINADGVEFKFTIIEKPEVKLGKYKALGIKKEKVKVTKEEVEHEITHLQEHLADIVELEEGTVEEGNTAVIDFEGFVDGKKLDGGTGTNYPLEIGSHTFIPGFEEGLVGMKIGEEKELNLKFPDEYVDNLKGKDVTFKVKVTKIKKRVLPEINEDFFKDLGYEDVKTKEELEKEVEKHLTEHKEADAENKYIGELLNKAIENMEVEVNPEIIDEEINRMLNQYRDELKMQGITLEQYLEFTKTTMESLKKMMEPEAINRIKSRYLLEAIAEKEKIEITAEETKAETTAMAKKYEVSEEDLLQMIGGEDMISYDLKMRKALEVLKNN